VDPPAPNNQIRVRSARIIDNRSGEINLHKQRNVPKVFLEYATEISKSKLDVKRGDPGTL
jgi:hypothetical protein